MHILLLDDEIGGLRLAEIMLQRLGHTTLCFRDSDDTCDFVDAVDWSRVPECDVSDLVITNYMMPGKCGDEVADYIRSSRKLCHVPIIMCSASAHYRTERHEQFFEKNGIALILAKPFSLGSMARALDQAFAVCQPPEYSERIIQKDAIDEAIEQEIRQQMKRDS